MRSHEGTEYITVPHKKSNYNSKIYVEKCEVCGKSIEAGNVLESHHIVEQKNFDENKLCGFLKKDAKKNIAILCASCHDKIDTGEIITKGRLDTSEGDMLDFEIIE